MTEPAGAVAVPGFTDAHAHLLSAAARIPFAWAGTSVAEYHAAVAGQGSTPMDLPEPLPREPAAELGTLLLDGLRRAAATGLVEVTEMGMHHWWYLDVLAGLQRSGPLPVRVRVYASSGLADRSGLAEMNARRGGAGPWVSLDGVKFYADGWLGPRTCAVCRPFADHGGDGMLFTGAAALARRVEPLAAHGWRPATHAIGDRAVAAVLDAYDLVWANDRAAMRRAAPRIEHASLQSADLTARIAEAGVVACIQPSFAVTDAGHLLPGLGPDRRDIAYPWAALAASGARMLAGSDYPIEVIDPLAGLARLVNGRSERAGFATPGESAARSRLGAATAFGLHTDPAAGQTLLSADPRAVPAADLDKIEVLGTRPVPFAAADPR